MEGILTSHMFLTCNTLALSSSILLIINLTWGFPFFLEVIIVTVLMLMTYGLSIFGIMPTVKVKFQQSLSICRFSDCHESCHSNLQKELVQLHPTGPSPNRHPQHALARCHPDAADTFQAGVNPPGGVWQDNQGHNAGNAIYSTHLVPFHVFLVFNTFALATSVLLIILLTNQYPFQLEIVAVTVSMMVTYGSALFAVVPDERVKFCYNTLTAFVPVIIRVVIYVYRKYAMKA
ncbi:uncharacterized protein LOC130135919 [Syzygium oleosum]|uniref:uncharacterized protein LOC130135919 n=1 Tax=Syzygium oleosum TaxID=219896 RepID=UPI0024BA5B3D|nr:uncharacterized protein LOC130135919 [Syzygium oleosum]